MNRFGKAQSKSIKLENKFSSRFFDAIKTFGCNLNWKNYYLLITGKVRKVHANDLFSSMNEDSFMDSSMRQNFPHVIKPTEVSYCRTRRGKIRENFLKSL